MSEGPDIALIGALIGDPARAQMLSALMGGRALSAGELAREAGVTPQTASAHLARMTDAGLLTRRAQGRARYYALAGADVADTLETLMTLSGSRGPARTRPGPRDPDLRRARTCYDHLAGALGVQAFDSMLARGFLDMQGARGRLSAAGAAFAGDLGVDAAALDAAARPACRACLDWSERRSHLAGGFGAALLARAEAEHWLTRRDGSRALTVTRRGAAAFDRLFPI